jgi:diacylglycerol kinase family enzyme
VPYQVDGDFLGQVESLRFRYVPDALDIVFP